MTELKFYLGLLTYYGKFLPNLSTRLASLYALLSRDVPWKWSAEQETAFHESKNLLIDSPLLVHFEPKLPLLLACGKHLSPPWKFLMKTLSPTAISLLRSAIVNSLLL